MKTKKCGKCHETKPVSEFHRDNTRGDGFRAYCKLCRNPVVSEKITADRLRKRYDDGDTKIDVCKCGSYYLNEIKRDGEWIILDACLECEPI